MLAGPGCKHKAQNADLIAHHLLEPLVGVADGVHCGSAGLLLLGPADLAHLQAIPLALHRGTGWVAAHCVDLRPKISPSLHAMQGAP